MLANVCLTTTFAHTNLVSTLVKQSHGFTTGYFPYFTKSRFGYAVKGKGVICIAGINNNNNLVSILSCDAWKNKLDFNTSNCFCYVDNNADIEISYTYTQNYLFRYLQFGLPYGSSCFPLYVNNSNYKLLASDGILNFNTNPSNKYAISNLSFSVAYPPSGQTTGGIGALNVDLMAILRDDSNNSVTRFTQYMDGNYIAMIKNTNSTYVNIHSLVDDYTNAKPTLLIGWDPSNPDITQDSAWTEYDI